MADIGQIGRSYLIALWSTLLAVSIAAILVGFARAATGRLGDPDASAVWRTLIILVLEAIVLGVTAWGLVRRRRWSYYSSFAMCVLFVLANAYSLGRLDTTNARLDVPVPWWIYAISICAGIFGLGLLVTPGTRAQFPGPVHKT